MDVIVAGRESTVIVFGRAKSRERGMKKDKGERIKDELGVRGFGFSFCIPDNAHKNSFQLSRLLLD